MPPESYLCNCRPIGVLFNGKWYDQMNYECRREKEYGDGETTTEYQDCCTTFALRFNVGRHEIIETSGSGFRQEFVVGSGIEPRRDWTTLEANAQHLHHSVAS